MCVPLWGQAPKVMLRNYSSEHGLPSSEVHKIYEDCTGYQWIGTDNGISCFNGYSFRNFGPLDGLEDPVVLQIQEDSRNALWICSMSGRLYCKTGTKFVAHPANKMILEQVQGKTVQSFLLDHENTFFIGIVGMGILKVKGTQVNWLYGNKENIQILRKRW